MTDLSMPVHRRGTPQSIAELHRLCDQDYASNAARRGQDHRDDAFLIAQASETAAAR